MAKQVTAVVKLQCPGGTATPAPPVGPALGAKGVSLKATYNGSQVNTTVTISPIPPVTIISADYKPDLQLLKIVASSSGAHFSSTLPVGVSRSACVAKASSAGSVQPR